MKNNNLFIIGLVCCLACSPGRSVFQADKSAAPAKAGYDLVWQEEFAEDGKPNSTFWSYEKGFTRNKELQYYQEDNARLKDGLLVLEGRRQQVKNAAYEPGSGDWRKNQEYAQYSSSSIHTRGKKEFQYGLIEVRARLDTAMGMWPAIWTLGVARPWPANGEVDVMEYYRVDGKATILANAAWQDSRNKAAWNTKRISFSDFLLKDPDWPGKFHVWKMDWTPAYIRLYLDDRLLNEINLSETKNPDGFNPFQQPHYLLLNLAVGGNGGDPAGADFPRKYEVDYVRVYQKRKGI